MFPSSPDLNPINRFAVNVLLPERAVARGKKGGDDSLGFCGVQPIDDVRQVVLML